MDFEEPKVWMVEDSWVSSLNYNSNLLLLAEVGKVQTTFPDSLAARVLNMNRFCHEDKLAWASKSQRMWQSFFCHCGCCNHSGYVLASAVLCSVCISVWSPATWQRDSSGGDSTGFLIIGTVVIWVLIV